MPSKTKPLTKAELAAFEAKRDLAYTWNSVSEVAFGLGFNDTAYFSRFFSKRVGISPAAYRKKMRVEAQV